MFSGNLINDSKLLEKEIEQIKFYRSINRMSINIKKNLPPQSCLYGYTHFQKYSNGNVRERSKDYPKYFKTKLMTEFPHLETLFKDFSYIHFPIKFKWNQVQINKNFQCDKHIDRENVGNSCIIGLGSYTGGELVIENENKKEKIIDIKYNPFVFNGSKLYHYVKPFTKHRYTLVFYYNDLD